MKEIIQQFINQIEQDQKLSGNTKSGYRSDLNDLIKYVESTNTQISDINQSWVKTYLKHLESINKERNSFNRRASTFRIFLRFLYKNKLAPTNYSLIVNNLNTLYKIKDDELKADDIKNIIESTRLKPLEKLIVHMIGRLGLTATQIASISTFQVDFENKLINLSDEDKINLPFEIFTLLREYLLEIRTKIPGSDERLNLFLNESGKPVSELDIYKLIKNLSKELSLQGKFTTRNLKRSLEDKNDIFSMQREILSITAPS